MIADRTASQQSAIVCFLIAPRMISRYTMGSKHIGVTTHESESHDVVDHVIIRFPYAISYWWSLGTKDFISNGFRDIQWRM